MKRYCKNVDILNIEYIERCMLECLSHKLHRHDVCEFFSIACGLSYERVRLMIDSGQKAELVHIAAPLLQSELSSRELVISPIWYTDKIDASSGKMRRIGIQDIKQQFYDYIAVNAMPDFLRRIGEFQCASIPGRGPIWGMKHLYNWVRGQEGLYVAQLDVRKCFPSIPHDKLFSMLDRYVANDDLIWLIKTLVSTFEHGLSIGSYLSQYLCNLYMSFLYHEVSERMYVMRRDKRVNLVDHIMIYMDNIVLVGKNKKHMHTCIKQIIEFCSNSLGLTVVIERDVFKMIHGTFVDFAGFRIYNDHVTIRRKTFIRSRRCYKKAIGHVMTLPLARKCVAYYGYYKHTNMQKAMHRLKIQNTIGRAKEVISNESKVRH